MHFSLKIICCSLCFAWGLFVPAALCAQDISNQNAVLLADNVHKAKANADQSKKAKKKTDKKTAKSAEKLSMEEFGKRILEAVHRDQYASALVYCEQAMGAMDNKTDEDTRFRIMSVCFELYDKNGKSEEALALGEKIKPMIHDARVAESYCFSEATLLTKLHRWSEARQKYAECPGTSDEGRGVVESNVAELYMIEGDCENAVSMYRQSIVHNPENPHAYFGLASALSRLERWDEAHAVFLDGVEQDPKFSFLKSAFFEPACENDYQTGYRLYELGQWEQAIFYLDRYVAAEMRQPYRDKARALVSRLKEGKKPLAATYPVLLDSVRSIAVDDLGEVYAFSVLVRETAEQFETQIWTLDVANERAQMRLSMPGEIISDMAFVPGSRTLRMLGPKHRYELELEHPENGYFIYDNSEHVFALNLMSGGDDVLSVNGHGQLIIAPWLNPYLEIPIVEVPLETKRLRLTSDHKKMALTTTLKTLLVGIEEDRILKAFTPLMDVSAIAVHPNKNLYALGIQSGVLLVDETGNVKNLYGSSSGGVQAVAFIGNGDRLAVLTEHLLEIWHIE
ncbi:MAG: tetratricopeptide repeat protein [Proteobacteria bacterium]|nr:tetratricopeptide repeat protein [Pseudomonadota bacterium]